MRLMSCSFLSTYIHHLCLTKQNDCLSLPPVKAVVTDDLMSPKQGAVKGWYAEKSWLDLLEGDTSRGATELKGFGSH